MDSSLHSCLRCVVSAESRVVSLVLTPLQSLAGELDWSSSLLGVAEESRRLKMYVPRSFSFTVSFTFVLNLSVRLFGELCSSCFILE